jgi:hypothetical protein
MTIGLYNEPTGSGNYQNKLKTAVIDLENGTGPITEQVESHAVNLRRYK